MSSEDKILTEDDMDLNEAVYSEVEEDDDDDDDDDSDEDESGEEEDGEEDGSEDESDNNGEDDNANGEESADDGSEEEDSNEEEEEGEEGVDVEAGNQSDDSSSGDNASEICPICLNRLRHQDIGTPESCDHCFCLECIQEWARNVNTCPVDRQVFRLILGRHAGEEKIFQQFPVEDKQNQEVVEEEEEEDPTFCEVCHQSNREDRLLLCDGCDLGYHCDCLTPPLAQVPVDEWFCPECQTVRGDAKQDCTAPGTPPVKHGSGRVYFDCTLYSRCNDGTFEQSEPYSCPENTECKTFNKDDFFEYNECVALDVSA